jgi:MFS family permease
MLNVVALVKQSVFARFKAGIWVMLLVNFLNSASFSIGLPFLALYLSEKRGISTSLIGLIMLIGIAVPAIPQLLAGTVADKLGRRPLMLLTGAAGIVFFILLAVSIGVNAPVAVIALLYTLTRSAIVMQRPGISAMAIDLAPQGKLIEVIALFRVVGNLGWAAGPAIGGLLATRVSYAWLFGLSTILTALALLIINCLMKESFTQNHERVPLSSLVSAGKDKNLLVMTIFSSLVFLVLAQLTSTLSIYTVEIVGFNQAQYGFLLTLNGLLVAVFQYPLTRLMGRFGDTVSLALGAFFFGAGYLTMTWVGEYSLAVGAIALLTAGEIIFSPVSTAVVGRMAPPAFRGRYMGFFGAAETLGMALGLFLGGYLLDVFRAYPLGVWGIISFSAFAAAIGFSIFRIEKRLKTH